MKREYIPGCVDCRRDASQTRPGTLLPGERPPRHFKNKGSEAWFYAGRGKFFFHSTFADSDQRDIAVPTKMILKALLEIGLIEPASRNKEKQGGKA